MWSKFLWFLDWLGRVQTAQWIVAGITGVTVSAAVGALSEAPMWALVLLFFAALMVVIGGVGLRKAYSHQKEQETELSVESSQRPAVPTTAINELAKSVLKIRAQNQALLKIEYKYEEIPNEGFFNWFTDEQGKNIQRYRIRIRNLGHAPIQNAEVKLETIEPLESEMCGIKPISSKQVGYSLKFEKSGSHIMNIHGNDSEWVTVLSYEKRIYGHVSIEGADRRGGGIDTEGKIMSPHNPHRIKIVVRGAGVKEDTAFFFVQLETIGGTQRLTMKQLDS